VPEAPDSSDEARRLRRQEAHRRVVRQRRIVAGVVLAISGLLLIVATHWGHFG
jgi:hypothetical protein